MVSASTEDKELLHRLISYSKDYISLINPATSRYRIFTDNLTDPIFRAEYLYDEAIDFLEHGEAINLESFYKYTPGELQSLGVEEKTKYNAEKAIAKKLEEISGKLKINEYTKQIILNFGFFTAEFPVEIDVEESEELGDVQQLDLLESGSATKVEKKTYPLFSIPVEIVFENQRYSIKALDEAVITNTGFLNGILTERSYYDFLELISEHEASGRLTLPLGRKLLEGIWDELKAKLRLSEAIFDDKSFELDQFVISLSSKSNYFLSQDLIKLSKTEAEDLTSTALGSWVPGLNDIEQTEPNEVSDRDIFFPFEYNRYQRNILRLLPYKASIVEGPPGTGKSQTIANLLCHLAAEGKKVLFLSQKPQALKVVKDKLKELSINHLFGYIPDRYSQLYDDAEEADSAASSLVGVADYVQNSQLVAAQNKPNSKVRTYTEELNAYTDVERKFTKLYGRYASLKEFDISAEEPQEFIKNFDSAGFNKLLSYKTRIEELSDFCSKYVEESGANLSNLNTKFKLLDFPENFSIPINETIKLVGANYYDRRNKIGRVLMNKLLLRLRSHSTTNSLPLEIVEELHNAIDTAESKAALLAELSSLKKFFLYKESVLEIDSLNKKFTADLTDLGLSRGSFSMLHKMIEKLGFSPSVDGSKEFYAVRSDIRDLHLLNPNEVNSSLHAAQQFERNSIKIFIENRLKRHMKEKLVSQTTKSTVARIARSLKKGKRAYKTFDEMKKDVSNFLTISDLIPIWVMSLEDASRLIPLNKNIFDYIILDESSQCNLAYAIPAMFRSKHVLFFGDSEQMRDDSIRFKSNNMLQSIAERNRIPDHLQIKSQADSVKSVLDIGTLAGFEKEVLRNHYRSPKELIGFSNKYFYAPKGKSLSVINSTYVTYKDTNKILLIHEIKAGNKEDLSAKTNHDEAVFIKNLIREIKNDPKLAGKSIGVLTFFNEQAFLLREVIDDPEVKISIIEGIQGDEKDIVIYSFVISDPSQKKRYVYLSSEGGDINKDISAGRVNVAFSRAKIQAHCVTSLPVDRWPEGIWIKKYLEYVQSNGEIDFFSVELKDFDSNFEEEFYYYIRNKLGKEFLIQNQIESCGYKIDFVITNTETGEKLAVECDGPTHFIDENSDIRVETDFERQAVLESAGWEFYRVPYSKWTSDENFREQLVGEIHEFFNLGGTESESSKTNKTKVNGTRLAKRDLPKIPTSEELKLLFEEVEVTNTSKKKDTAGFEEVFRFELSPRRFLVVSRFDDGSGLWMNEYLDRENYQGFTSRGVGVADAQLSSFIANSKKTLKTGVETRLKWLSSDTSELVITKLQSTVHKGTDLIDIRQYVNVSTYQGYTKKGLRMSALIFEQFIDTLESKLT